MENQGLKRLIVHDLPADAFAQMFKVAVGDHVIAEEGGQITQCIGCFGCWVKTPGRCVIRDGYAGLGKKLYEADAFVVISRCCYGGYSPFVKNVFDRTIAALLPYFTYREDGRMHHQIRGNKRVDFSVHFYGEDLSEKEKATAQKIVQANALNINASSQSVRFYDSAQEAGRAFV